MSDTDRFQPGYLLHDRYEIRETLGSGGFAVVYAAFDRVIERDVAIKVLNPHHLAGDEQKTEQMLDRFLREARVAARIRHASIIEIYDFGVLDDDGHPYIIMEFLRGQDLGHELLQYGPMEPTRLFPLFIDSLEALGEAHAEDVVHKDLKPANLFLSQRGTRTETLKIVDFGIAHVQGGTEDRITTTGAVSGTPQYLSPEYIEEQSVTPAMDIYQMGLILVESLTGKPVIQATNLFQAALKHVDRDFSIPQSILDGPLGELVETAIAYEPSKRFDTAEDFADALSDVDPSAVEIPSDTDFDGTSPAKTRQQYAGNADAATHSWAAESTADDDELSRRDIEEIESAPTLAQSEVDADFDQVTSREPTGPPNTSESGSDDEPEDSRPDSVIAAISDHRSKFAVVVLAGIAVVSASIFLIVDVGPADETDGEEETSIEQTDGDDDRLAEANVEDDAAGHGEESEPDPVDDEPDVTTVEIASIPEGAEVQYLDGTSLGTTPLEFETIDGESPQLRLTHDGHHSKEFTVDSNVDEQIEIVLAPRVESEPETPEPPPEPAPREPPTEAAVQEVTEQEVVEQEPTTDEPTEDEQLHEDSLEEEEEEDDDDSSKEDDDSGELRLAP